MCKRIIRAIPNTLTCCNLLSGCIAVTFASGGDFGLAALFIFIGGVFDFLDGMTARLLHVSSPIGRELDSLSDVVTFGLAPAMMIHSFLTSGLSNEVEGITSIITFIPFLMTVFSALRLARFNLDERQATSFIGLPTSANGLFWAALLYDPSTLTSDLSVLTPSFILYFILALVLLFSWLLVSPIPIFSMKFHNLTWRDNYIRYIFLAVSIVLIILLGIRGGAAVIGWYIVLSLLTNNVNESTSQRVNESKGQKQ